MDGSKDEIAQTAARMVVEEGLDYSGAKRRALKQLGLPTRTAMPDNQLLEAAVRDYIAVFCADTQPGELYALRALALEWMRRLEEFRPYVGGAVWRGTATRHSDVYLQLFCDDPKSAELRLIDKGVRYTPGLVTGLHGAAVDALSIQAWCEGLGEYVGVHLFVNDLDGVRGALRPDADGQSPRGDQMALEKLMQKGTP